MRCPCCHETMNHHDTVISTRNNERIATIWRCEPCASADDPEMAERCKCDGYYTENQRGHVESGDSRRWLC